MAFTPCLQYQYASGKNTSDIALALDALEALFDHRADMFCLVTSDSDFAYLCRKLRERGASVCIVGEAKTPDALRNASDQFFEWSRTAPAIEQMKATATSPASECSPHTGASKAETAPVTIKRRPKFVVEAVSLLASGATDGKVAAGLLGGYLKRTDPGFSPSIYGHAGLVDMIKTYDLLTAVMEPGDHWMIGIAVKDAEPDPSLCEN
ncbi:hypothetical protein CR511_12580 [Pseudomonas putida]|nr:hypothetical protein CR511_12580 [Pseudomonas putida]